MRIKLHSICNVYTKKEVFFYDSSRVMRKKIRMILNFEKYLAVWYNVRSQYSFLPCDYLMSNIYSVCLWVSLLKSQRKAYCTFHLQLSKFSLHKAAYCIWGKLQGDMKLGFSIVGLFICHQSLGIHEHLVRVTFL